MTNKKTLKGTLTYKMVSDEARELSMKLQNTVHVIQMGNTLFSTLSKKKGIVLCSFNMGNPIKQLNSRERANLSTGLTLYQYNKAKKTITKPSAAAGTIISG